MHGARERKGLRAQERRLKKSFFFSFLSEELSPWEDNLKPEVNSGTETWLVQTGGTVPKSKSLAKSCSALRVTEAKQMDYGSYKLSSQFGA